MKGRGFEIVGVVVLCALVALVIHARHVDAVRTHAAAATYPPLPVAREADRVARIKATVAVASATQIIAAYGTDPATADGYLKANYIKVQGIAREIAAGFDGKTYVAINVLADQPLKIHCFFKDDAARPVTIGAPVTVFGRCDGMTSSNEMRKCERAD